MASGKSTVGRIVAEELGWSFRDLDEVIVEAAGRPVAEIFASEGEEGFRRREQDALREVSRLDDTVIAAGGGAACREENLRLMLASGRVIALSVDPTEVLKRVGGRSGRPLLDTAADPLRAAADLLAAREPFYSRAHHRVDTVGNPPAAVAAEVIRVLRTVTS